MQTNKEKEPYSCTELVADEFQNINKILPSWPQQVQYHARISFIRPGMSDTNGYAPGLNLYARGGVHNLLLGNGQVYRFHRQKKLMGHVHGIQEVSFQRLGAQ